MQRETRANDSRFAAEKYRFDDEVTIEGTR